jgi:hypothetical protein
MRLRLFCLLMCPILVAFGEKRVSGEPNTSEEKPVQNAEMNRFDNALREVMTVSKDELKRLQAEDEARKADKPRRGPKPTSIK